MFRILAVAYGVACYLGFAAVALYAVDFVGNCPVPKTIDGGEAGPWEEAVTVDVLLLLLFGVQHSGMARPGFKRFWTRRVPAPVERSTYVLTSSIGLGLLFALWRPLPAEVWHIEPAVSWFVTALAIAGIGLMALASFQIDHCDLFGLRQMWAYARGRPYAPPAFQTPGLYRVVRHPMMLGLLLALWAVPHMTVGHLLFSGGLTLYVLIGVRLEERGLRAEFGACYAAYQRRVPRLLPLAVWPAAQEEAP